MIEPKKNTGDLLIVRGCKIGISKKGNLTIYLSKFLIFNRIN